MVLGMNTEIVELREAIQNKDSVNIQEELSDFLWYFFVITKTSEVTLNIIMRNSLLAGPQLFQPYVPAKAQYKLDQD